MELVRKICRGVRFSVWHFFLIGLCFHSLFSMMMLAYMQDGQEENFFSSSFFLLSFSFLAYGFSLFFLPHEGEKKGWKASCQWIENQWQQLMQEQSLRRQHARQQGVSSWSWYSLPWLGWILFLSSWVFFLWIFSSVVGLAVGLILWCVLFKWQTLREDRWGVGKIDHRFINLRLVQFLSFYLVPLSIFHIWIHSSSVKGDLQDYFSMGLVVYSSFFVLPSWWHLLMGQRTCPAKNFYFWEPVNSYGCFGKVDRVSGSPGKVSSYPALFFLARWLVVLMVTTMIAQIVAYAILSKLS